MKAEVKTIHHSSAGFQENEDHVTGKAKYFYETKDYEEFPIDYEEKTIVTRFEKIVEKHPKRLAVKMGERSLTYNELNRAANRIAQSILAERGEKSEPIALLFENRFDV